MLDKKRKLILDVKANAWRKNLQGDVQRSSYHTSKVSHSGEQQQGWEVTKYFDLLWKLLQDNVLECFKCLLLYDIIPIELNTAGYCFSHAFISQL